MIHIDDRELNGMFVKRVHQLIREIISDAIHHVPTVQISFFTPYIYIFKIITITFSTVVCAVYFTRTKSTHSVFVF